MDPLTEKTAIRFLSFSDDKDLEKEAKLKEAALKIEQAIAKEKSLNELIDYKPPAEDSVDPTNDTRPLYERLLEQRNKKQQELEESQKLSNLVTKLDEEDVAHLNEVARTKNEEELKKRLEVFDALEAKKRYDAKRMLEEEGKRKNCLVGIKSSGACSSIKSKISSMIKVKPKLKTANIAIEAKNTLESIANEEPSDSDLQTKNSTKRTTSNTDRSSGSNKESAVQDRVDDSKRQKTSGEPTKRPPNGEKVETQEDCLCARKDIMQCIGVLPSLPIVNNIENSSDSDNSDEINQQMFKSKLPRHRH